MSAMTSVTLSEAASNIVENLACRVAEHTGGTITPNHLMPYLPMSLELIVSCLDAMVDGSSVFKETRDNILYYEIAAYRDGENRGSLVNVTSCVSCNGELSTGEPGVLCPRCFKTLHLELNRLAERIGWPAQAVYEHEILYLAARHKGEPVAAEALAGRSRYTLKRMRHKLDVLSLKNATRQAVDQATGEVKYLFPAIDYPDNCFRRNMKIITSYPASVMEEVQLKIVRILFSLGLLLIGLLVLGFLHIPFPLLVMIFIIAAPIISLIIWTSRKRPDED